MGGISKYCNHYLICQSLSLLLQNPPPLNNPPHEANEVPQPAAENPQENAEISQAEAETPQLNTKNPQPPVIVSPIDPSIASTPPHHLP